MRSSVMSVTVCVGGWKQPPHAAAWRSPAKVTRGNGGRHPQSECRSIHDMPPLRANQPFDCDRRRRTRIERPDEEPEQAREGAEGHARSRPPRRGRGADFAARRGRLRPGRSSPVLATAPGRRSAGRARVDARLRLRRRARADCVAAVVDGARQVHALGDGADVRELGLIGRRLQDEVGRHRRVRDVAPDARDADVGSGQPGEERVDVVVAHLFGGLGAGVAGARRPPSAAPTGR